MPSLTGLSPSCRPRPRPTRRSPHRPQARASVAARSGRAWAGRGSDGPPDPLTADTTLRTAVLDKIRSIEVPSVDRDIFNFGRPKPPAGPPQPEAREAQAALNRAMEKRVVAAPKPPPKKPAPVVTVRPSGLEVLRPCESGGRRAQARVPVGRRGNPRGSARVGAERAVPDRKHRRGGRGHRGPGGEPGVLYRSGGAKVTEGPSRGSQEGYALLVLLATSAVLLAALALAIPRMAMQAQRVKEERLIQRGEQYSRAIKLYYRQHRKYPARLDDLEDTDGVRYLRGRPRDPLGETGEWRLIPHGNGRPVRGFAAPRPGEGHAGIRAWQVSRRRCRTRRRCARRIQPIAKHFRGLRPRRPRHPARPARAAVSGGSEPGAERPRVRRPGLGDEGALQRGVRV